MLKEKNQLDFSVIICCYNFDLEKLKKTFISIYKQKDVSFEIIITDDGSTNNYNTEIKQWVNKNHFKNVKYNFLEKNGGTIKNILSAFDISEGQYIKLISPGDYLYSDDVLKVFKETLDNNNDVDMVYGDTVFFDGDSQIVRKNDICHSKVVFNRKYVKDAFCLYGGYFMAPAMASRRYIYTTILSRFKNKVLYVEDGATVFSYFIENKKTIGIEKPVVWYECFSGISNNSSFSEVFRKDEENLYKTIAELYPNNKYAKRIVYKYNLRKVKKYFRIFIVAFKYPGIFLFRLRKAFMGRLKNDANIEQMMKFTSIAEYEK